jgi:hypothetical protein
MRRKLEDDQAQQLQKLDDLRSQLHRIESNQADLQSQLALERQEAIQREQRQVLHEAREKRNARDRMVDECWQLLQLQWKRGEIIASPGQSPLKVPG